MRTVEDRIWFTDGAYIVTLYYLVLQDEAKSRAPVAVPIERHLVGLLMSRAEGHK